MTKKTDSGTDQTNQNKDSVTSKALVTNPVEANKSKTEDANTNDAVKSETAKPKSKTNKNNVEAQNNASDNRHAKSKNDKPVKTGFLWFVTSLNFIVLCTIAVGAYWLYEQHHDKQSNAQQSIQALESQITQLQGKQNANNSNIEDIKIAQTNLNQNLDNAISETVKTSNLVNANSKRLAELSGRRPSDWLLAEASYLVNMAGRKVYLERDLRTAMQLLLEADERLKDLNDPSLFPVRALIASDLQNLKQVNPVSKESIAMAINGMKSKIDSLPLDTLKLPETEPSEDLTLSNEASDWRQNLSKTWKAIVGDFISIKQIDAPLEPYLAERQQWLINQELKHAMSQAQSAVLDGNVAIFTSTMQNAIAIIIEHYQLDQSSVGQFLKALQELQNKDLNLNLPSKLESQASLKDILNQRLQNVYRTMPSAPSDDSQTEKQENQL